MKRISIITLILFVQLFSVNAQTLKDKFNATKGQLTGGSASDETTTVSTEAMDQYGEAEKFLSGTKVYKITQRPDGTFYHDKFNGEFETMERTIIDPSKADENLVTFGSVAGTMGSEVAPKPLFYTNKNQNEMLVFINGTMFHVGGLKEDGSIYKLMGIYTIDKGLTKSCTKWDKGYAQTAISNYYAQMKPLHDAAINDKKDNAAKDELAKREKYTIVGKQVSSIRVSCGSGTMKQGETYTVVVVATLKDGTTISTLDNGYSDEYEITATGLPETYEDPFNFSMKRSTVGESTITVPDVAVVSGDKIIITVKAKHDPTLKASTSAIMDYSGDVILNYNAEMRSDMASVNGGDLRIEIKKVKHAETQKNVLEYKVFNGKNVLLKHFRIDQNAQVTASVNGQKGWRCTSEKKPPMNGTNGGNIKVIVDLSVDNYNLSLSSVGGQGGAGGYGYQNGSNGQDGKIETVKQKVNW